MTWRVGIDSGGTFTDICVLNQDSGLISVWKVPSTPGDPSEGIARALSEVLERLGARADDISLFGHGTTVGTNALLQHRGAKTGLITTKGFIDLLEIGRQRRPHLYDLQADLPQQLVTRGLRLGVEERLDHSGKPIVVLNELELRDAASRLRAAGVEAVAVCFLYSFVNPVHEERASEILREELPGVIVSTSSAVSPEFREFERLSTTVVNAYLGPIMDRYIGRLWDRLSALGMRAPAYITQSNGGVMSFAKARGSSVRTILSGPSTGIVAAEEIGRTAGLANLITFDMGGTSSDVALIRDGKCAMSSQATVEGYPIRTPQLDVHTVGAGGGSIAYVDESGLLKVGPRSAGADPGPACYGLGNLEPTVTDANVVLGTLSRQSILGGRLAIQSDLAVNAVGRVAEKLGVGLHEAAQGIIDVATANIARAIRVVSVQRGHDPQDYTLLAFGGAGPLHAARLAAELDVKQVLVPANPGLLCAFGLLLTDLKTDFALTRRQPVDADLDVVAGFADLLAQGEAWFENEKVQPERRRAQFSIDMRYVGQNYELSVPIADVSSTEVHLDQIRERFAEAHRLAYGFVLPGTPIELVTYRLQVTGLVEKAKLVQREVVQDPTPAQPTTIRSAWFPEIGRLTDCPVFAREGLHAGSNVIGPAIIEQMDTTVVVLPGMTAKVDAFLNLILEVSRDTALARPDTENQASE